jgi:hypothetical protein
MPTVPDPLVGDLRSAGLLPSPVAHARAVNPTEAP